MMASNRIARTLFLVLVSGLFTIVVLFVPMLYVQVNNFSAMSRLFLCSTSIKQRIKHRIKCLTYGHNAVPHVRFEPANPCFQVKHCTN